MTQMLTMVKQEMTLVKSTWICFQNVIMIDILIDQSRDKLRATMCVLKTLLHSTAFDLESKNFLDRLTFLLSMKKGFMLDDAYASDQLDMISKNVAFIGVLTKMHSLVSCHLNDVIPKSKEARRCLKIVVNSLFMDMSVTSLIQDMFSWNVMTLYYSEDVTYNKADLEQRTETLSVLILLYLQALFRTDWNDFLDQYIMKKISSPTNISKKRVFGQVFVRKHFRKLLAVLYITIRFQTFC